MDRRGSFTLAPRPGRPSPVAGQWGRGWIVTSAQNSLARQSAVRACGGGRPAKSPATACPRGPRQRHGCGGSCPAPRKRPRRSRKAAGVTVRMLPVMLLRPHRCRRACSQARAGWGRTSPRGRWGPEGPGRPDDRRAGGRRLHPLNRSECPGENTSASPSGSDATQSCAMPVGPGCRRSTSDERRPGQGGLRTFH